MMDAGRRERAVQLVLLVLLFACYAYFLPRRVDWNQNSRMDLTLAIVDAGTLQIDAYRGNTGDYARFGDHYYSDKAPGTSFVGVPFYALFRWLAHSPAFGPALERIAAAAAPGPASAQERAGLFPWRGYYALALYATTLGAVALPAALLGLLLYRMTRHAGAGVGAAAVVTLIYGLGTTAFPYGGALYGHMPAAFCLFLAFYLLATVGPSPAGARRLAAIGFLLAWAVVTELPMELPASIIGLYAIYLVRAPRRLAWLILGALPPAALLAGYNLAIYGTPLPVGYQYSELWIEEHSTGFMTLTGPTLQRLWGITLSPFRGLFFLSPALLFAFPGLVALVREPRWRVPALVAAGVIVSLFLFNASSVVWWGGFAVGPRYIAPAVPFLAWPVARWLTDSAARRWSLGVAGALSVFSVWTQTITSLQFYPPENVGFPLLHYSLPRLFQGEMALNLGTALGLRGPASLLPLLLVLVAGGVAVWALCRPPVQEAAWAPA